MRAKNFGLLLVAALVFGTFAAGCNSGGGTSATDEEVLKKKLSEPSNGKALGGGGGTTPKASQPAPAQGNAAKHAAEAGQGPK